MEKKKICLVGAFAVGKTSLVRRYVSGVFSEEYLTTAGVKIDQKTVELEGGPVRLLVWDLAGSDDFARVEKSYLNGSSGFLFVANGTRPESVDVVLEDAARILVDHPGAVSFFLVNKADLAEEWALSEERLADLERQFPVFRTSALSGEGVEEAFVELARRIVSGEA